MTYGSTQLSAEPLRAHDCPPCPAHQTHAQAESRGLAAVLEGMGRCSDRQRGGSTVKANGFDTLMLWLLVGVSWEEPQLSGPQGVSAAAASPLPVRVGAPCWAAGTLTHYVHKDKCVGPLPYMHGYLNINRI